MTGKELSVYTNNKCVQSGIDWKEGNRADKIGVLDWNMQGEGARLLYNDRPTEFAQQNGMDSTAHITRRNHKFERINLNKKTIKFNYRQKGPSGRASRVGGL